MTDKNELLHMLDQAIELVRKEPGYVAPFAFHLTHLEAMRTALAAPSASAQQTEPVAHVPVHPRNGPLWMDTIPLDSEVHRSNRYPLMALYAAPAPSASPAALTDERKLANFDGMLADLRAAIEDRDYARAEVKRRDNLANGTVWYWQGDGTDRLESLTCDVVIRADDLRALLAASPAKENSNG